MRILFCGSRDWTNEAKIKSCIQVCFPAQDTIIHGAAPGADSIAGKLARELQFDVEEYPADWALHGKAAGFIRNQQMLDTGLDFVFAFSSGIKNSRGTSHMISIAKKANVTVALVE